MKVHAVLICVVVNNLQVHLLIKNFGAIANIFSCLQFVARQNPELDAGFTDLFYGLGNLVLQLVLNCCGTQDVDPMFKILCSLRKGLVAAISLTVCLLIFQFPSTDLFLVKLPASNDQRSKT